MSDPLEVEVVAIDGEPPPPRQQARAEDRDDWFRFDRRFTNPGRGSSLLGGMLGAFLAIVLLVFGMFALALVVGFKLIRGIARTLFPGPDGPSNLSSRH
jgi:hypothetical protein